MGFKQEVKVWYVRGGFENMIDTVINGPGGVGSWAVYN